MPTDPSFHGWRHPQHPLRLSFRVRLYLSNSDETILEMLDEKNPVVYAKGRRRYKMTQFLTETIGLPAIRAHIWQVVGIGNASKNKKNFDENFMRAFPQVHDQFDLLPEDD